MLESLEIANIIFSTICVHYILLYSHYLKLIIHVWCMGLIGYHVRLIKILWFLIVLGNRVFKVLWKLTS